MIRIDGVASSGTSYRPITLGDALRESRLLERLRIGSSAREPSPVAMASHPSPLYAPNPRPIEGIKSASSRHVPPHSLPRKSDGRPHPGGELGAFVFATSRERRVFRAV